MKTWQYFLIALASFSNAAASLHYWHITGTLGLALMALVLGSIAVLAGWKAVRGMEKTA